MNETWENIKDLMKERDELQRKLDRSFAIQELWPDVFKYGKCRSYLTGNLNRFKAVELVIKNGNGEKRKYPVGGVPKVLILYQIEINRVNGNDWQKGKWDELKRWIEGR